MDKKLLLFVKIIGDKNRLRILNYLKKECCVSELWKKLGLPQNLTSHHLKILKDSGFVTAERRGLKIVYKLDKKYLNINFKLLQKYLK